MIKLIQKLNIKKLDGTIEEINLVHLYADKFKHFEQDGIRFGYYILLGVGDSEENYQEVDGGIEHEIPNELPDLYDEELEEEEGENDEGLY